MSPTLGTKWALSELKTVICICHWEKELSSEVFIVSEMVGCSLADEGRGMPGTSEHHLVIQMFSFPEQGGPTRSRQLHMSGSGECVSFLVASTKYLTEAT